MKIIPDNPADVKMIKKENYLNIMDVLLAFSVKFPVTVFDYLHGYTTGMWNTLFLHLRHWTNTLNIYVSAYLCKEVLLLPRFNFTKPHSYWAHTVLWATGSTVWVPKMSHRVEKQTLSNWGTQRQTCSECTLPVNRQHYKWAVYGTTAFLLKQNKRQTEPPRSCHTTDDL